MAISPNVIPLIVTYFLILTGAASVFFVLLYPSESLVKNAGRLSQAIVSWIKHMMEKHRPVELSGPVKRVLGIGEDDLGLPPWLARWSSAVSPRLRQSGLKNVSVLRYLGFVAASSVLGFSFGMIVLHNFTFALALAVAAYVIPDQTVLGRGQKLQQKYVEQLSTAVRLLQAELQDYGNIQTAFSNMARQTPAPLGELFRNSVAELNSGQDPVRVFSDLRNRFGNDYGKLFVQLVIVGWYDDAVLTSFSSLALKLHNQRTMYTENQKKLHGERMVSIGLNAIVLPIFLYSQKYQIARDYFQYTFLGKLTLTMWVVSIILGIVMERMFAVVD